MESIKKVDFPYLLITIFGPFLAFLAVVALAIGLIDNSGVGSILCSAAMLLMILWWTVFSRKLFEKQRDAKLKELADQGFVPNHTFNADGCTLVVDLVHGQIALLFRWNPKKVYVRPASAISQLQVDDGRGGVGPLAGSSRVRFLFSIEGITIKVNTFTSNRRWRMDSDYILTGISKADVMVKALTEAGAQAK